MAIHNREAQLQKKKSRKPRPVFIVFLSMKWFTIFPHRERFIIFRDHAFSLIY